jgi:hypothetical protein
LKQWRDRLLPAIAKGGLVSLDIDETVNLLAIGVESETVGNQVLSELDGLLIPRQAAKVFVDKGDEATLTLTQYHRPVQGGFLIGPSGCTLGFNARQDHPKFGALRVFLTASHCSEQMFRLDHGVAYQPGYSPSHPDYLIGYEIKDPTNHNCDALHYYNCRMSDASMYEYEPSTTDDWGYLARTTGYSLYGPGSIEVDSPPYHFFAIMGKLDDASEQVGEYINKMGRRTGWTRGPVTQTCVWSNWGGGFEPTPKVGPAIVGHRSFSEWRGGPRSVNDSPHTRRG